MPYNVRQVTQAVPQLKKRLKMKTKTASVRFDKDMLAEIDNRCEKVGCSRNDFVKNALNLVLYDHANFDFGDEDNQPVVEQKHTQEKIPVLHFHWEGNKLVQDPTTWKEKKSVNS